MSAPSSAELREHLVTSRIAGDVATSREDNLMKYGLLAARLPQAMFGLTLDGRWGIGRDPGADGRAGRRLAGPAATCGGPTASIPT